MLATVHLLTGAMIGAAVPNYPAIVITSLFSHYLLDAIPHIDPDTFNFDTISPSHYNWKQITIVCIDTLSTITFALVFYHYQHRWAPILVGGLAAQIPDLLIPLEKYAWYYPFAQIHDFMHWEKRRANQWSWYIAGIVSQIAISAIAITVITRS